jgi:hypothetical protein
MWVVMPGELGNRGEQCLKIWYGKSNLRQVCLFIITEKVRVKESKWDGVGVMKDKELKLEDVKAPHTLGWASYNYCCTSIPWRSRKPLWGRDAETEEPQWVQLIVRLIVKIVVMGRVWVCMLLCCSQIHYRHMVAYKQTRGLGGLGCAKNQKVVLLFTINR